MSQMILMLRRSLQIMTNPSLKQGCAKARSPLALR
jgi:hypothetical protein